MPDLTLFSMPDLVMYAIPAFVLLLVVEAIVSAREELEAFETKDTFASLAMGVGNVAVNLLVKGVVLGTFWLLYDATGFFRDFLSPFNGWSWALLFFADDFTYYWFHRLSHEIRFLWASHVVHHSSQHYNLGTALRQTWTGNLTGTFLFWAWLPVVGFHPLAVMGMKSISLLYQFWIHTETIGRLPQPVEWVFNTPSHHRVHHSSQIKYLDKNHAGMLIIWDRLFGTFQREEERPTYGLVKNFESHNPVRIAFHEWQGIAADLRKPIPWKERLGYVFGPPGWSHDGSRQTTEQMRRAWREEREEERTKA